MTVLRRDHISPAMLRSLASALSDVPGIGEQAPDAVRRAADEIERLREDEGGVPIRSVSTEKARQELEAAIPRLERSLEALREASRVTQEDLDTEACDRE